MCVSGDLAAAGRLEAAMQDEGVEVSAVRPDHGAGFRVDGNPGKELRVS
jgi:hypothetical protein